MKNWNASNYIERKARRRALQRPEWFKNPDTDEEFYLRPVDALLSSVLAGYLPGGLTKLAVEAWQKEDVEGMGDSGSLAQSLASKLTPEQIAEGDREMESLSRIIQECCVIPLISRLSPDDVQFSDDWKVDAIRGLKEKDPKFDEATFDPKQLVLHPKDLDGKDSAFLFRWAQGLAGSTALKGGNVSNMNDVARFRKKPARGSRTRTDKPPVQQTA